MEAQLKDTAATLGESLLPIALQVVTVIRDVATQFSALDAPTKEAIVKAGLFAAALGPLLSIGGRLVSVFGTLIEVVPRLAVGFLDAAKAAGGLVRTGAEVIGYLVEAGAAGALLVGAFVAIAAGAAVVVKFLIEVGKAASASNDDLIKMSRSGDLFLQSAASAEILMHGADRVRAALDGVNQELRNSAPEYANYIAGLTGAAQAAGYQIDASGNLVVTMNGLGGATSRVVTENYALTASQWLLLQAQAAATTGAYGQAGALDESNRAAMRAGAALQGAAQMTSAQADGMRALAEATQSGGAAQAEYQKWLEQSAAVQRAAIQAEADHRNSIAESITSNGALARSLKDVTTAQATQSLATAQLDTLKKAYEDGTITQQGYEKATEAIMLRYGLATPVSIAMAKAQENINTAFLAGKLPLDKFVESTGKIPKIAADGKVTLQELTDVGIKPTTAAVLAQEGHVGLLEKAWLRIPANVTTTYTIITKGEVPDAPNPGGGHLPGGGAALGANFIEPSGFPNDSFPLMVTSGEHVRVDPIGGRGRMEAATGGQTTINNNNFYDSLATKMYLEQQRVQNLQRIGARM